MGGMTPGSWSRTTLALAVLFGSLPVVSRVLFGAWAFGEAGALGGLCLMASAYLHIRERRKRAPLPDDAAVLEAALELARDGRSRESAALLDAVVRTSPRFWQAFQLRGELRLREEGRAAAAERDFSEAIALAPGEPHLYVLRALARRLSGDSSGAERDLEALERLAATPAATPFVGTYLGIPDCSTQQGAE